ncbi:hypothetical protein [Agromyces seonyuensis]|uniref:Uncharacterized protein n=1 Tax=Agromyces seonyuensis TaxID=2662446 RepID=A0A6I4P8I6_9MICO|nr:hypothetical protein [Agromyces seonyuensis]MWC00385.1 hypothetical protein [Agromyces seonyuensis]
MIRRRLRLPFAALSLLLSASALAACVTSPAAAPEAAAAEEPDGWVVVAFEGTDEEFDLGIMDTLLETELAADEALAAADAGWIDGNDVGEHGYELYFVGQDAAAMWRVLEPVFADAPVPWTRVELRDGLEDENPVMLSQG